MSLFNFNTIDEFKLFLENEIKKNNRELDHISKIVGEKIRQTEKEFETDKDFQVIKEKLENKTDEKKKKKKKNISANWISYGSIHLYNGIGTKGELEIYFKEIESLKSNLNILDAAKKSVDELSNKGLKNNLGCIIFKENEKFEIVLSKSTEKTREKFSFKSQFLVPAQKDTPLFAESALK